MVIKRFCSNKLTEHVWTMAVHERTSAPQHARLSTKSSFGMLWHEMFSMEKTFPSPCPHLAQASGMIRSPSSSSSSLSISSFSGHFVGSHLASALPQATFTLPSTDAALKSPVGRELAAWTQEAVGFDSPTMALQVITATAMKRMEAEIKPKMLVTSKAQTCGLKTQVDLSTLNPKSSGH